MNAKDRRLGVGAGREPGMVIAKSYYDITPPDEPYHIDCGGRVKYDSDELVYEWKCLRCNQRWEAKVLRHMKSEDISARFYMFPKPDPDTYVIVQDTDGFKTFTRTVKWSEAVEKKLKKIPDPTK